MCVKRSSVYANINGKKIRVDRCLRNFIEQLNQGTEYKPLNYKTLSCCCGHGKYPATIIVISTDKKDAKPFEWYSGKVIPRIKRFYRKDKAGFYFIPEVSDYSKPHNI